MAATATQSHRRSASLSSAGARSRLPRKTRHQPSVVSASLWMVVISLALFFLPAINGLIGGFVGGYKAGTVGRALVAAILPAVVVSFVVWGLLSVFGAAVLGVFAGATVGLLVLLADLGLFVGAVIGGLVGRRPGLSRPYAA